MFIVNVLRFRESFREDSRLEILPDMTQAVAPSSAPPSEFLRAKTFYVDAMSDGNADTALSTERSPVELKFDDRVALIIS